MHKNTSSAIKCLVPSHSSKQCQMLYSESVLPPYKSYGRWLWRAFRPIILIQGISTNRKEWDSIVLRLTVNDDMFNRFGRA